MSRDTLDTLASFQLRLVAMPPRRAILIRECLDDGDTWQQIADALDMTIQGARKAALR